MFTPLTDTVRWNGTDENGVWRSGQQSLPDPQGGSISSYAILDLMLTLLNNSKVASPFILVRHALTPFAH